MAVFVGYLMAILVVVLVHDRVLVVFEVLEADLWHFGLVVGGGLVVDLRCSFCCSWLRTDLLSRCGLVAECFAVGILVHSCSLRRQGHRRSISDCLVEC